MMKYKYNDDLYIYIYIYIYYRRKAKHLNENINILCPGLYVLFHCQCEVMTCSYINAMLLLIKLNNVTKFIIDIFFCQILKIDYTLCFQQQKNAPGELMS